MTGSLDDIHVTLGTIPPLAELEEHWCELASRSEHSFFQSWAWIGCWLQSLPQSIRPRLLQAKNGGRVIGLGILILRTVLRRGLLPSRGLFLNSTGDPVLDKLTVEHNGLLSERGLEQRVVEGCLKYLLSRNDWDEWYLAGVSHPELFERLTLGGVRVLTERSQDVHFVDLNAVRGSGRPYLDHLGSSTRAHIRRSFREYEKLGELAVEVATTPEQAVSFLAELKRLHAAYWRAKGLPGAFANEFLDRFHARLVRSHLETGMIQLLRLRAGGVFLGYLYNFVHQGRVYTYQSGFDYAACEKHNRPGLVAHSYAVEFNRVAGHAVYDFLAGEGEYKLRLGTGSERISWLVLQRPRFRFRIEDWLRFARARWRSAMR